MADIVGRLLSLNLPWSYRPREHDDWGWIRDATGDLAACARGEKGSKTHHEHRDDGTDPYGEYAAFIVRAVNAHEALVKALEEILKANDDFRAGMPDGWEGDPLQDACEVARKLVAAVGGARE